MMNLLRCSNRRMLAFTIFPANHHLVHAFRFDKKKVVGVDANEHVRFDSERYTSHFNKKVIK